MQQLRDELDGVGPLLAMAAVFFGGLLLGFGVLAGYERWERRAHAGHAVGRAESVEPLITDPAARLTRLGLLIAAAIGLYNLATGLGLGATRGGVSPLTLLLITGLVLTNALYGFSATAPLTSATTRPGWGLLIRMGLIGGAPLAIGALASSALIDSMQEAFLRTVDRENVPDMVRMGLLALAGGAIVYALAQLIMLAGRRARAGSFYAGIITAVTFGFAANMVMVIGGLGG